MAGKEVKAKVSGKYKHGATGFSVDKLMVGPLIVPHLSRCGRLSYSICRVFLDTRAESICVSDTCRGHTLEVLTHCLQLLHLRPVILARTIAQGQRRRRD